MMGTQSKICGQFDYQQELPTICVPYCKMRSTKNQSNISFLLAFLMSYKIFLFNRLWFTKGRKKHFKMSSFTIPHRSTQECASCAYGAHPPAEPLHLVLQMLTKPPSVDQLYDESNEEVRKRANMDMPSVIVGERRWKQLGHVQSMKKSEHASAATPQRPNGKRKPGSPRETRRQTVQRPWDFSPQMRWGGLRETKRGGKD